MLNSARKSFKRVALGIGMGVAGLLGTNVVAQENNQSYQNPPGSSQGTMQEEQTAPSGSQGRQNREQSGQTGSQYGGSQAGSQSSSPSEMKGGASRETASASQKQTGQSHQSAGTIRSVDSSSKTLSLRGAKMHRDIAWSDQTRVLRNGKEVSPEELKKGERVSVTYSKQGDQLLAQQIVIRERQQARATKRHHRGY